MAALESKREPRASRYFDDETWPVQLSVVALGGMLIGLCFAQRPADGPDWIDTAWPIVNGIGIATIVSAIAVSFIDSLLIRRPLQLSLVLCVIVHALLIVQMVHSRLESGVDAALAPKNSNPTARAVKRMADYRPVAHLPDETRPRQDFEKPVEAETPVEAEKRETVVREEPKREQMPMPVEPQPAPESELKPQAQELNRQVAEQTPEQRVAEAEALARSVREAAAQAAQAIELPKADAEPSVVAPEVHAATAAVNRRDLAALPEVSRSPAINTEEIRRETQPIEQPRSETGRRVPVYQPAITSTTAEVRWLLPRACRLAHSIGSRVQ
jgi:multidrug transporter EmrE-like cation transporter